MSTKKYVSLNKLSLFLDNLKDVFAILYHTHVQSEITDLIIDNEISSTSTNLVENRAISSALETVKEEVKNYTDTEVANLVDSAPDTLNTLGELATALQENEGVVAVLNSAITNKAEKTDLTSHTSNTSNPHNVTVSQLGLSYETWTFTLSDGSNVTKNMVVM